MTEAESNEAKAVAEIRYLFGNNCIAIRKANADEVGHLAEHGRIFLHLTFLAGVCEPEATCLVSCRIHPYKGTTYSWQVVQLLNHKPIPRPANTYYEYFTDAVNAFGRAVREAEAAGPLLHKMAGANIDANAERYAEQHAFGAVNKARRGLL